MLPVFFSSPSKGGLRRHFSVSLEPCCSNSRFDYLSLLKGNSAEAGRIYERAQAIESSTLGEEHPAFASTLNNRAMLLQKQVSAMKWCVNPCSCSHPCATHTFHLIFPLCLRLSPKGQYAEAKQLILKSVGILEKVLGSDHPMLAERLGNLADVLGRQVRQAA